jgi:hypothetical protein
MTFAFVIRTLGVAGAGAGLVAQAVETIAPRTTIAER